MKIMVAGILCLFDEVLLRLRLSPHALKEFTDNRCDGFYLFTDFFIFGFTCSWIFLGLYLRLCGADCQLYKESVYSPRSKEIRKNQSAVQAHRNPKINLIK